MVYNELIKSFEVYNFKFNQPKPIDYTNMIQSLSYLPMHQPVNNNCWFSVTTPPDVVPFFIANDIQTSLIFFHVVESGLIILMGFIFIFLLLRLHNLIFWFLDAFTEQDLSEFRQIVKISAPLLLTSIRYTLISIEFILIIILAYNLWSYIPVFFLPPSLFFPNFQTPKDSLIRGFDDYNFNRMPFRHEDFKAFKRFRPFAMYYAPLAKFRHKFDISSEEHVWLRNMRAWADASLDAHLNGTIIENQIPDNIGPAQYLFLQQIAGFDWFRENIDQNLHLKFIKRLKLKIELVF